MAEASSHLPGAVEKRWPGETFICIGSGPSLTVDDVEFCRGKARIVAVNDAYVLAPFADCLYACDGSWWDHHKGVPSFSGLKYGLTVKLGKWPGVIRLSHTGQEGFDESSSGIRSGGNSGFQAIQVAVKLGAARIVLLGYDMKRDAKGRSHFFGEHPKVLRKAMDYTTVQRYFKSLVVPMRNKGIEVVNCSRDTAIQAFPRMDLHAALAQSVRAVA